MKKESRVVEESKGLASWLKKAATRRSKWERKEDLLDAVYWWRQVVSAAIGIALGLVPITGVLGFMIFAVLSVFLTVGYARGWQHDDMCETSDLMQEGLIGSIGIFLSFWIVSYSIFHWF